MNRRPPNDKKIFDLFLETWADDLESVFLTKYASSKNITVFGEYVEGSIIVFDILQGQIVSPKKFIDDFGHLPVAECCGYGAVTIELARAVMASDFGFVDFRSKISTEIPEGIVCKWPEWACKIKTTKHIDKEYQSFL